MGKKEKFLLFYTHKTTERRVVAVTLEKPVYNFMGPRALFSKKKSLGCLFYHEKFLIYSDNLGDGSYQEVQQP